MREVQEVMRMESELRSLIHLMVARHATDAHLTLRFGRLTLRLRCPERMIDDDSGMFDGRLLHYLKYISHLDLGAMSTPQSGSCTRQYQDRLLQFRFACLGTQQLQTGVLRLLNLQDLPRIEECAVPCAVPSAPWPGLAQRTDREREIDDPACADA